MFNSKKTASTIILVLFLSFSVPSFLVFPANATEDSWTTMEPMPTARSGFGVAVVDRKVYAIGGYNGTYLSTNEMYDPLTDTWTKKTSMPTARKDFAVAVYQNKIYVFGGTTAPSDSETSGYTGLIEVYNPSTDSWETKTSMPTPRAGLCASVMNNKIYLIGGKEYVNQSPQFYNSVGVNEVYDPETDTWTTKTHMPHAIHDYASAVVENKTYVIGGVHQFAGPFYHNLEIANRIYDAETDTWTSEKAISTTVADGAAGTTTGVLAPKRIYVIGGWNDWEIHGTNLTQIYDPETDEWTYVTPMPTPRYGMCVAVVNDELYAIGGYDGDTRLAVNEKYTPLGYIPEFPSGTLLLILLLAITVTAVSYKRKLHNSNRGRREK